MFDQFYSKETLKHVRNPQNIGRIRNPDGVATVGNPVCGDIMKFYLKIGNNKKGEFIKEAKFQTLGCGAAIATSSMMTVLIKGKPLREVSKISKKILVKALGGLPPIKIHCSLLADEGVKMAIADYQRKKRKRS